MKLLKIAILSIAILFILFAAALMYVLSSSFQTNQTNAILAQSLPGSKIGNVSVGFGALKVENINIVLQNGDNFTADSISASYKLSALLSKKIDITNVDLKKAKFIMAAKKAEQATSQASSSGSAKSAAQVSQTPAATSANANETKKEALNIGYEIVLHNATANFQLILADGSNIATITEISSLELGSNLMPKNCSLTTKATAYPKNSKPENFILQATLVPDASKVSLKTVLNHSKTSILQAQAKLTPDYTSADFDARVDISNSELEPIVGGMMKLPKFTSAIYAAGNFSESGKNLQTKIIIKNNASDLKNIAPVLEFMGKCGLDAEIDLEKKDSVIAVSKLNVVFTDNSDSVLSLNVPNAFSIDINDLSKLPEGDLAVISVAVPLKYVAYFAKDFKIEAEDIGGKFSISRGADNTIGIKTITPVTFADWNISQGKETLLKNFNALMKFTASTDLKGNYKISNSIDIADSDKDKLQLLAETKIAGKNIDTSVAISGSLAPIVNRVESMSVIASMGLRIDSKFDASYTGDTATLKTIKLDILDSNGKKSAQINDGGSISYNIAKKSISSQSKTLLKISAPDFPFALLKPFAAGTDMSDISINAEIEMSAVNVFGVSLSAAAKNVSFKQDGKFVIKSLSPSINASAVYDMNKNFLTANVAKLLLNDGVTDIANASASVEYNIATKKLKDVSLKAHTAIAPLLNQPVLLNFANVATGSAELEAILKDQKLSAAVIINSLAARGSTADKIEKAVIKADAKFSDDFSKIDADASINANSTLGEAIAKISVKHAADTKVNIDVKCAATEYGKILSAAFSNPNADAATAVANADKKSDKVAIVRPKSLDSVSAENTISTKKDSKAFWNIGRSIYLDAKIGKLTMGGKNILENFSASASCEPQKLAVANLKGAIYGADMKGSTTLEFNAKNSAPYTMTNTKLELAKLEVSKVFTSPEKAMITGEFSAELNLNAKGNNMQHMLAYTFGSAKLTGTGGLLRLIDKTTQSGAMTSLAGSAMKIAGLFLKNKAYEVGAMGDIIGYFETLKYESANIFAERDTKTMNINLTTAEIKTEALMLQASGGVINMQPDIAMKQQKLNIPVSINIADGSVRKMFQKLNFGTTQITSNGYYNGPKFTVTGTVGEPNANLIAALMSAQKTADAAAQANAEKAAAAAKESTNTTTSATKSTTTTSNSTTKSTTTTEKKNAATAVRGLLNSLLKKN